MDLPLFWRGLVLGFSIAAPVGPIGVLCLRRTLAGGRLYGLVAGLGAATADAAYGLVAGLGLTLAAGGLTSQGDWLRPLGGVFLCYLGVRTALSVPASQAAAVTGRGLVGAYVSTLALTLTNPLTILSFAAVFAGLGLAGGARTSGAAVLLVAGVFCGSAAWWLLLVMVVGQLRGRVGPRLLRWVNRVAGIVMLGFGLLALLGR